MLVYLLFLILAIGTCLAAPSFTGHRFSADDFSHGSRDIVVASVASHSFRINNLRSLVESLEGQVNRLNVFLLDYTGAIPPFLSHNWVTVHLATKRQEAWGEWTRLFWADGLHEDTGGCYHFLLDENLIYPKNYVSFTVEQIENYGRNIIVGMHGRRFTQGFSTLLASSVLLHFNDYVAEDIAVHMLSTKTLAYHTSVWPQLAMHDIMLSAETRGKADVNLMDLHVSFAAQFKEIPLVVLRHPAGWIGQSSARNYRKMDPIVAQQHTDFIKGTISEWRIRSFTRTTTHLREMSIVGVEYHHPTLASLLAEWDELDQLRLREPLKDKTPGATSNRLQGKIEKIEEFFRLAVNPHMRTVCEIRPADGRGLLQSGGRSTLLWLHSNPDIRLLSFDGLSGEDVIPSWQLFVSTKYPARAQFVRGDPLITVPLLQDKTSDIRCDFIYLTADALLNTHLRNVYQVVNWNASYPNVLVVDGVGCSREGTVCAARTKAWKAMLEEGRLVEHSCFEGETDEEGHCVGQFKWVVPEETKKVVQFTSEDLVGRPMEEPTTTTTTTRRPSLLAEGSPVLPGRAPGLR